MNGAPEGDERAPRPRSVFDDESPPTLPDTPAAHPPPADWGRDGYVGEGSNGSAEHTGRAAPIWYRTDQERSKSVYRRANPWYRQFARTIIGLALLAIVGTGVYLGAREVQSYLDRDQLPEVGLQAPSYRWTSFLVTSSAAGVAIDGNLTIDRESGAFEYLTRGGTGADVVSPDGTRFFRRTADGWVAAEGTDPDVARLRTAIPFLLGVNGPDDVLVNRLRKGYVDLLDTTEEGAGADALDRYELTLDTRRFSTDYPLQWQSFQQEVIPSAAVGEAVPLTIWIDADNMVVRLRDEQTRWAWQRVAYGSDPFPPAADIDAAVQAAGG